jgi:glycosyltransferase involved in cell wall biosynthesis
LVIQLEDNEKLLTEKFLQRPFRQLVHAKNLSIPDNLSHPQRYREFLAQAHGVTVIIDQLRDFVPEGIPTLTLWPGVETNLFFPRPPDPNLIRKYDIPLNSVVLCYTGNVHAANAIEVRSLYLAVAMLNREGMPTTLLRAGKDYYDFLGPDDTWARTYARELGYVKNTEIPNILALADVLIQPGRPDEFNNYRFPSKLPEFLSMGKPVILPATNVGCFIEHMRQAIVLPIADALHIIDAVKLVMGDRALYNQLAEGATAFARQYLDWHINSEKLYQFYASLQPVALSTV